MLNKILEGKMLDKHGKYRDEGKYEIKKCRKERNYMGGKSREM